MDISQQRMLASLTSGSGQVTQMDERSYSLQIETQPTGYTLAQLDDYHKLARKTFKWKPPLHLKVQARASLKKPVGTLGFGFWNDPFSLSLGQSGTARRFPAAPQAAWFFYASPPNDIAIAPPIRGSGWKASVLRSPRIPSLILAPIALAALAAARLPQLWRLVMKTARMVIQVEEVIIENNLNNRRLYELIWEDNSTLFLVDGEQILHSTTTPHPPLGFVTWIDNQYAIASPDGGFRFGVIPTAKPQALELFEMEVNGMALSSNLEVDA